MYSQYCYKQQRLGQSTKQMKSEANPGIRKPLKQMASQDKLTRSCDQHGSTRKNMEASFLDDISPSVTSCEAIEMSKRD